MPSWVTAEEVQVQRLVEGGEFVETPGLAICQLGSRMLNEMIEKEHRPVLVVVSESSGSWTIGYDVGNASISNLPSKIIRSMVPWDVLTKARLSTDFGTVPVEKGFGLSTGKSARSFLPHARWITFPHFIAVYLWSRPPFHEPVPRLRTT